MTTDLEIQTSICTDVILPIQRGDSSYIVPRTTLTADASTTSIAVADLSIFGPGCAVDFADDLGEPRLSVARGTGGVPWPGTNPVPLDFTNLGYGALKQTHPSGTTVYTGLFDITPWEIDSGLLKGYPVIFVRSMQDATKQATAPRGNYTTYQVDVQIHRILNDPQDTPGIGGARTGPNAWAERQERLLRGDVALIKTALLANQTLIGENHTALAVQMAPLNSGEKITTRWRSPSSPAGNTHLYACLTAVYVALA